MSPPQRGRPWVGPHCHIFTDSPWFHHLLLSIPLYRNFSAEIYTNSISEEYLMLWENVTLLSKKDKLQKNDIEFAHNFNLIFINTCMANNTRRQHTKLRAASNSRWWNSKWCYFLLLFFLSWFCFFFLIHKINDSFLFMLSVFLIFLQGICTAFISWKKVLFSILYPLCLWHHRKKFFFHMRQNSILSTRQVLW